MSSFRIRPRFNRVVYYTPDRVQELFRTQLDRPDAPCKGSMTDGHIFLRIPAEEQHYWSPQLNLSLYEHEEGTEVYGVYGPRPSVWSAFFYGYAILGMLAAVLCVWGCALWMLKKDAYVLWGLPVLGGIALLVYLVAQGGQKMGAEQTFTLHHFFEDTVGEKTHIR